MSLKRPQVESCKSKGFHGCFRVGAGIALMDHTNNVTELLITSTVTAQEFPVLTAATCILRLLYKDPQGFEPSTLLREELH